MEKQEYEGHWWPPEDYGDRVGGILSYSPPSGASLKLFEAFESGFAEDPEHDHHSRLYGVSKSGNFLTLVNCHRSGYGSHHSQMGQVSYSSYQPRYVLDGIHVPQNQNISFTEIKVSFPGIKEWSNHVPRSTTNNPSSGTGLAYQLKLQNPNPLEAEVMEYTAKLLTSFSPSHPRANTPTISSDTYFRLNPKHPAITLPRLRGYVSSLRDLLTLATNHTMEPDYVQARIPDSGSTDIKIFFGDSSFGQSGSPSITNLNFRLEDIPGGFEQLMESWFKMRSEVKSSINVFLGTRYSSGGYQQDTFLSLTQAVESYHRRRYDDEYMDSNKYNSEVHPDIMEVIRGDLEEVYDDPTMFNGNPLSTSQIQKLKSMRDAHGIPNALGNVLDSAIKYANEFSLRKRFKELVNNDYNHIIDGLPHSAVGKIDPIIKTRNHFTHQIREEKKAQNVAEGAELTRLSWSVEQLLEAALLSELGVPDPQVRNTLERRYRQYRIL